MHEGVEVEASKNVKDELHLFGNDLENVSQSAADIQQICRVRNKDIRKVRSPLSIVKSETNRVVVLGRSVRVGERKHPRRLKRFMHGGLRAFSRLDRTFISIM